MSKLALECHSNGPANWFRRYKCFLVLLVALSSDSYLSLQLISSNLFGANLFDSGHSLLDFRRVRDIKTATILIQNVPQMLVQIAFAVLILHRNNNLIMASVTISFLLSVPILLNWLFGAVIYRKIFTWKQYDLELLLVASNPSIISQQNSKLVQSQLIHKYKGYKAALKHILCSIIGISTSILRVAYIEMNDNDDGATIHILHRVAKPDKKRERDSKSDLAQLYEGKYEQISQEIHKLYHIDAEWSFVCCMLANDDEFDHHDDDADQQPHGMPMSHRQSSVLALRLSQHQKAGANHPETAETQLTEIILDTENHEFHPDHDNKHDKHNDDEDDEEEDENGGKHVQKNKKEASQNSDSEQQQNRKNRQHEYVPSETVTPFALDTIGNDAQLIDRRIDAKRKGMDMKPQHANHVNTDSTHSAVNALNAPNLSNQAGSARAASLNIIHEPQQQQKKNMIRTPSVVVVTSMNEQGVILNADDNDEASTDSSDENEYKMQLPSYQQQRLRPQQQQQSYPEQYLQQQAYSNPYAAKRQQPRAQEMVRSAPPDMYMRNEETNVFKNSESIGDDEIPDVPHTAQSSSQASDVFGVGSDDVFSPPVHVTPMQIVHEDPNDQEEVNDEEQY